MNEALVKFMSSVGITTYVPTENDYLRLAYETRVKPVEGSPEAVLETLVLKIYHFDHYYGYSDDNRVWRAGVAGETAINTALDAMDDKVTAANLRSCFGPDKQDALKALYPWLSAYLTVSQLTRLVKDYDISVSEAGNLIAVGAFINKQLDELRKRQLQYYTVYAKNPEKVRAHIREAREMDEEPLANPVTIPNDLYQIWGLIGELLEQRGVYPVMKGVVNLQVLYQGNLTRYQLGHTTLFM